MIKYKLDEMAQERADAIISCMQLGRQFIKHFDKIYHADKDDDNIHHWESEMQAWYDMVKRIKLKHSHKSITNDELIDWFFTSGADFDDLFDDTYELYLYEEVCQRILENNKIDESIDYVILNRR